MNRHTFAMQIKEGNLGEYRKILGEKWKFAKLLMDEYQINNFSLWSAGLLVFGYCETEGELVKDEAFLNQLKDIFAAFAPVCEWISDYNSSLRLMFHRYGDGRQDRELSYKRFFCAKLHDGQEEEYKTRHDAIAAPSDMEYKHSSNNNFTIWYGQGYIFGYSEVDSTMEKEKTPEGFERSRKWETKMLEIMDWVTNDVDWLTGEYHENYHCIAEYR